MNQATFYTDHWRDIDEARIARYERMFQWHDRQAALLAPLELRRGHTVLDFGCGPGFLARGMAGLVGPSGQVYGVDLNARFVADATRRASEVANVSYRLAEGDRIPLDDHAVDRVLCKNVLEYVPDAAATLAEFRRVLKPGGRMLAIDSDWGFVVVEPCGREATARFFAAAAPAFREPNIGRKLRALATQAGFVDVEVTIRAGADTEGGGLSVLHNMASYAGRFDQLPASEINAFVEQAEAGIANGTYLFCLPQFLVTGVSR